MYKRLRDGLFAPKQVVSYIKDKLYRPILQLLIYALILIVPAIINVYNYKGIDSDTKAAIKETFSGIELNYKITDGVLTYNGTTENKTVELSDYFNVLISPNDEVKLDGSKYYVIVLGNNEVSLYMIKIKFASFSYKELDSMMNFDLSSLSNANNTKEWDIVFSNIDDIVHAYMKQNVVAIGLAQFLSSAFWLFALTFVISLSFLVRFRGHLKYNAMFKMSAYYTAPYVITTLISQLLNLSILNILGLLICVIYTFIGSKAIFERLLGQDRK